MFCYIYIRMDVTCCYVLLHIYKNGCDMLLCFVTYIRMERLVDSELRIYCFLSILPEIRMDVTYF